jgi:hypothetical protein
MMGVEDVRVGKMAYWGIDSARCKGKGGIVGDGSRGGSGVGVGVGVGVGEEGEGGNKEVGQAMGNIEGKSLESPLGRCLGMVGAPK